MKSAIPIETTPPDTRTPDGDRAPMKLNIGCGLDTVPGYENLDNSPSLLIRDNPVLRALVALWERHRGHPIYTRFPGEVRRFDATRQWDYGDQSVAVIYSSHMLEHLSRERAEEFLRQAHRTLRPRGVLRLALPDLERLAREYLLRVQRVRGDRVDEIPSDAFMHRAALGRACQRSLRHPARFLQSILGRDEHLWMWDGPSLVTLCRRLGFSEVSERGFRDSSIPEIELLEPERRRAESFYLEALR